MEQPVRPEAIAIAMRHAREDVALLARLVREGKVQRGEPPPGLRDEHRLLRRQVADANEAARPRVNLAIRPKTKKRRRG
jgi:hemerythrin-like domain-containing protein